MPRDTLAVQRNENIDRLPGRGDRPVGETDLIEIMAAADTRLVVLVGKDMISGADEDLGKGSTDRLDPLARLAAYCYRIVQGMSLCCCYSLPGTTGKHSALLSAPGILA